MQIHGNHLEVTLSRLSEYSSLATYILFTHNGTRAVGEVTIKVFCSFTILLALIFYPCIIVRARSGLTYHSKSDLCSLKSGSQRGNIGMSESCVPPHP